LNVCHKKEPARVPNKTSSFADWEKAIDKSEMADVNEMFASMKEEQNIEQGTD